jgi:Domain of unknown function (DUF4383)
MADDHVMHHHATPEETQNWARWYALASGVLLTAIGIGGWFADAHFDTTHHASFLGLWDVNGWFNLLHLVAGVLGFATAYSPNRLHVRWYAGIFGVIWIVLAIWGFYVDVGDLIVSGLPASVGANWFHLVIGLLGIAACAHGMFIPQGARHDDHAAGTGRGF